MPWPDISGRRKFQAVLKQLAAEVSATRAEVTEARLELESALAVLPRDGAVASTPVSAGRFMRLAWFCVICLTGAIIAATFALPVFNDPSPSFSNLGQIQVVMAVGSDNGAPFADAAAVQLEEYVSQTQSSAEYVVGFPQKYVGMRFAILLAGSAVLEDPNPTPGIIVKDGPCNAMGWAQSGWQGDQLQRCQAHFGTVPKKSPEPTGPDGCGDTFSANPGLVRILLGGFVRATTDVDLVHHETTLADFQPYSSLNDWGGPNLSALDQYHGFPLGGSYAPVRQLGCKRVEVNPDWKASTSSPEQSVVARSGSLVWQGDDASRPTVLVSTDRYAAGVGNGLLAFIGALAGLGIGFIPVAAAAWEEWRKNPLRR